LQAVIGSMSTFSFFRTYCDGLLHKEKEKECIKTGEKTKSSRDNGSKKIILKNKIGPESASGLRQRLISYAP